MIHSRLSLMGLLALTVTSACGSPGGSTPNKRSASPVSDSNSPAALPAQQTGIKMDLDAVPAQVVGAAPEDPANNLLANTNFMAIGPWGAQGDVSFVRNANDAQNAARLTMHLTSGQTYSDGAMWLAQTVDLPCDAAYVLLRYDAHLPGGQQFLHVHLTTLDVGGGVIDSIESFGNVLPGEAGRPLTVGGDEELSTSLTARSGGAKQLHVQFGMNDFAVEQFPPHATPVAHDGAVMEIGHVSVIAVQDPNGQTPLGPCKNP